MYVVWILVISSVLNIIKFSNPPPFIKQTSCLRIWCNKALNLFLFWCFGFICIINIGYTFLLNLKLRKI